MNRRHLVALLGALLVASASGPASAEEFPWIRIQVDLADKAQRTQLLEAGLDVTELHGLQADVLVNSAQLAQLQAGGLATRVIREMPSRGLALRDVATTPEFLPEYYTYAEAVAKLQSLAATYPSITDLSNLGNSLEGRGIWALKISDNAAVDEDEPEVLVMGCHHSREAISVIIPLALADSLLSNYGTDPQYTQWVDEREIWIVPVVNPDGLVYCETTYYFWRKNRRGGYGVDLNRNYDYEWGHDNIGSSGSTSSQTYRGASPASEPEIQAVQSFVDSRNFAFSLSYHSFGNLLLWGPGWKPGLPQDQDVFVGYGQIATATNGFEPGNPASSTIYGTNGSSDDWLYNAASHAAVIAMTPEVGTSSDYFDPPASRIPTLVTQGLDCVWPALDYADRPAQLAPPGAPALDPLPPDADGSYDVTWSAPTVADTEPVVYELVEKTGESVGVDGIESGTGNFTPGGFTASTTRRYAGSFSLYSGQGDRLDRICYTKEAYTVQSGDTFTFRAWWDIESDWDYAYVVLSTDGGRSFVSLPGTSTTMSDPRGRNADNGITGSSGGTFVAMSFDLSAFAGEKVRLGFRYNTDEAVTNEGFYADDISLVRSFASSTVLSSAIAATSFPVTGRGAGLYHYAVRGKDAEGNWGYWSDDVAVTVDLSTSLAVGGPAPAFQLSPGVPTPFGDRTEIRFQLPVASSHTLAVFDVAGRRVRTLSEGTLAAGPHTKVWDGRDEGGRPVPAGVYFLSLRSPQGELRERTVRLR